MSGAQRRSVILGTGSELPRTIVTNQDIEKIVDTSDEWITVRTGIKERRVLEEGKGNADMAHAAAVRALEDARERARAYEAPCGDFSRIGRYRRARQEVQARRQAMGRGGRRGERSPLEAEPGRLALVRRKGAPSLAMILGVHSIRGHRTLIDALLPHGAVVRLKSGVVKRIFWATPPLHVPRDLRRGEPPPAHVEPGGHHPVHGVVDRRDPVEHRPHSVGSDRHDSSPQRATRAFSSPSWSSTRATTKSTSAPTVGAPW